MENNITAVRFIKEQIELHSDTSFFNIDWDKFDEIIDKAKQMEKEHIIDAYNNGEDRSAEDYIKKTFKSE